MASGSQNNTTYQAQKWTNLRAFTIGNTAKNVDGTAAVSWDKDEILGASTDAYFLRGDKVWSNVLSANFSAGTYILAGTYLQAKNHIYMDAGHFYMKYNNTWYDVLHNHANGNISVNAAGTGLYMGYYNTTFVNWMDGRMQLKDGCLSIFPNSSNYREGIRIHSVSNWSDITLCGNDNTGDSGISANSWFIGNNNGNFYIARNGSPGSTAWLECVNNIWSTMNPLWIKGGSTEAGGNVNRLTTSSGMPGNMQYNTSRRGTQIYSNGIAFADPYNGNSNNDAGWIRHQETGVNAGELEIAVGDDGDETIVVRQYNTSNNVARRMYLLNSEGFTSVSNQSTDSSYAHAAMQIREANYAGASSDTWGVAPRLAWHWSGRVAAQIGLASSGWLYEAPSTGTNFYKIVCETGTWGIGITGNAATATCVIHPDASVSYIDGAKGNSAALYAKKTYNADHWYPAVALETKGGGAWQIGNYNDETLEFQYATKANRDANTNKTSEIYMQQGDTGRVVTSGNYTNWTVTKTGSGASGSWGISVTGSSASCTGNSATTSKLSDSAHSWTATEVYNYMMARVLKSGDDMTGSIRQKMTSVTRGSSPSANQYRTYEWIDSGNKRVAQVEYGMITNGESRLHLYVLGNNTTSTGDEYGGIVIYKKVGVSGNSIAYFNANDGTFSATTFSGALSGNAATASKVGEAASWLYFNHSNEVNFGGTNTSDTIYFGYRATDSRPKPATFVFGTGNGTATVKAATFIGALTGNVTGDCSGSAGSVAWSNVSSKPATATRWPSWSEVTSKPSVQNNLTSTSTTDMLSAAQGKALNENKTAKGTGLAYTTLLNQTYAGTSYKSITVSNISSYNALHFACYFKSFWRGSMLIPINDFKSNQVTIFFMINGSTPEYANFKYISDTSIQISTDYGNSLVFRIWGAKTS